MKNCLVLGSGRSGTSMVAGCIHGAGYRMGEQLMPPTPGNPKGYFESKVIERINERLLASFVRMRPRGVLGRLFPNRLGPTQLWLARVPVGTRLTAAPELERRMREQVEREPFCFKDPRFCYTLPSWRPLLPKTVYVCVFRDPAATVRSILSECRRDAYLADLTIDESWAYEVWSLCYRHILEVHAVEGRWLFLHGDQVIAGDGLDRLDAFLDARVDRSFPEASLQRPPSSDAAPDAVRSIYRTLCERAEHALP